MLEFTRSPSPPTAALLLLVAGLGVGLRPAHAEPGRDPAPLLDSVAWQKHFENWVERTLVEDELADAASRDRVRDDAAALELADALVAARVAQLGAELPLPSGMKPRLLARGARKGTLEATRLAAKGEVDEAQARLAEPDLASDPVATHLRVQLEDDHPPSGRTPLDVLELIDHYRFALSAAPSTPAASRARVRIAQLYLNIGFAREATAELEPYLDPPLKQPAGRLALAAYGEASLRIGRMKRAIASFDAYAAHDPEPELLVWARRRRADAYYALGRFGEAAEQYAALPDDTPDRDVVGLRLARARIESGEGEKSTEGLLDLMRSAREPEHVLLAGLLTAELYKRQDELYDLEGFALALAKRAPARSFAAALASTYWLEARRLTRQPLGALPPEIGRFASTTAEAPERGLAALLIAIRPDPEREPGTVRIELTKLAASVQPGPARDLVRAELSRHLHTELVAGHRSGAPPDPALLAAVRAEVDPAHVDEDALLLAIDALRAAGELESCRKWAQVLREREIRPIRRGLGAWREVQCALGSGSDTPPVKLADVRASGPFALAIAAIAGEQTLRSGDVEKATRIYTRALESFIEPRILGPVLLRIGELLAFQGSDALAARRLTRGLTLTDSEATAADPLRKAAIVTLARLAARRDKKQRLSSLLARERRRVEPWWTAAYDYLGYRVGAASRPRGSDLFSRVSRELALTRNAELRAGALGTKLERRAEERARRSGAVEEK